MFITNYSCKIFAKTNLCRDPWVESFVVLDWTLDLGNPHGQRVDLVCYEGEVARIVLHSKKRKPMLQHSMDQSRAQIYFYFLTGVL